jgi:sugar/nucleoside kinase (ribokinase family)
VFFSSNPSSNVQCIYCTWGEEGAGICLPYAGALVCQTLPAAPLPEGKQLVDSIGAGDTFIAVVIAQLMPKHPLELMDAIKAMSEAIRVCALKVAQEGFDGLIVKEEIEGSDAKHILQ